MGFNAKAIVIHGMDYRETDRIVRLVIENHGKASAMARGVRKPKSSLRGAVEPITYGNYHLNPGRNMYTISQAETIQTYPKTKDSLEKLFAASFLCELTDSFMEEGNPDNESYELLLGTLNVLEKTDADLIKTVLYMEVQIHKIHGIFPDLHQCAQCGAKEAGRRVKIDLSLGGALCAKCSSEKHGHKSYDLQALFVLEMTSTKSLVDFLKSDFQQNSINDASLIMQGFTSHYLGRELKSRSMMESTLNKEKS